MLSNFISAYKYILHCIIFRNFKINKRRYHRHSTRWKLTSSQNVKNSQRHLTLKTIHLRPTAINLNIDLSTSTYVIHPPLDTHKITIRIH